MRSSPWHDAMYALAHAYLRACDQQGVAEDGWTFDYLVAAADQLTRLRTAAVPPAPAMTDEELEGRRRAVEALREAARARHVELPEDVTFRLLQWILSAEEETHDDH